MRVAKVLLTVGLAGAAAVALAAFTLVTPASSTSAREARGGSAVQQKALRISGAEAMERTAPSSGNLAIAPGIPVRLTVTNYTREFHTITIPGLHVSALIFPARGKTPRKTTFTFTARGYGVFDWYCAVCTSGTHGLRHMMGGTIYAIVDPSLLA